MDAPTVKSRHLRRHRRSLSDGAIRSTYHRDAHASAGGAPQDDSRNSNKIHSKDSALGRQLAGAVRRRIHRRRSLPKGSVAGSPGILTGILRPPQFAS
jgi:hypothetical protein